MVLETGQEDMKKNLSPQNQGNLLLQQAWDKEKRRTLLVDLVDILVGGQLSSWVADSLTQLDKASDEYQENDINDEDTDPSAYMSIPELEPVSVVFLSCLVH